MAGASDDTLAARLARTLFPEWEGVGVEHSIQEQILADALATVPPPRTLRELLVVVEHQSHRRSPVALVTLVALRCMTTKSPDLPLDELAGR
jgi:hypothetical protein